MRDGHFNPSLEERLYTDSAVLIPSATVRVLKEYPAGFFLLRSFAHRMMRLRSPVQSDQITDSGKSGKVWDWRQVYAQATDFGKSRVINAARYSGRVRVHRSCPRQSQ